MEVGRGDSEERGERGPDIHRTRNKGRDRQTWKAHVLSLLALLQRGLKEERGGEQDKGQDRKAQEGDGQRYKGTDRQTDRQRERERGRARGLSTGALTKRA